VNAVTSLVRRNPLLSFFVLTYARLGAPFGGVEVVAPDRLFVAGPLVVAGSGSGASR
jgi:hypothetical protein